jgi:hypothetical protein
MNSPFDNIYHKILKIFKSKFATNGHDKLLNKIASGKEVFFENTFEEFVFRSIPKGGYEAKQKGETHYLLTNAPNKLVDAILEGKIITKKEYENY